MKPPLPLGDSLRERFGVLPDTHCVPDVLAPGLRVVFCGTALGFQSARARAYYAHPGNFFWRTLHQTRLMPHLIKPQQYADVLAYGIGLTDLCKDAYGQDTQLPERALDADGLKKKIHGFQPGILAFTSKTAAAAFMGLPTGKIPYGLQAEKFENTRLFALPSPSGQARIFWDARVWQDLADRARAGAGDANAF